MSFISNIMDSFKLNNNEGQDDDYFFDEEDDFEEEKPAKKSIFKKPEPAYDEEEEEETPVSKPIFSRSRTQQSNVVPMKRGMEVSMVKPNSMEDAKEICELLLSGKAVVLNMEGLNIDVAQRVIDFSCGATVAIDGNLQKISNYIYIATPKSVELSGDFQELVSTSASGMTSFNMRF